MSFLPQNYEPPKKGNDKYFKLADGSNRIRPIGPATQAAVARFESGRHLPSLATLRDYAAATGRRLVIGFEPVGRKGRRRRQPNAPRLLRHDAAAQ